MIYMVIWLTLATAWIFLMGALPFIQDRENKRKAAPAPKREPAPKPVVVHAH